MSSAIPPFSEIGRRTGRFLLTDKIPIISMNCYFDGSVGGTSNEWLTLGGLIATDSAWANFESDWTAMLKDRDPVAPYVHMTDLVRGGDPFDDQSGWDQKKREKLIWDAAAVLCRVPVGALCAFACSVDTHARKRLHAEGYAASQPAVICAEIGLGNLLNWYTDKHKIETAYAFYDRNEPFIRSIRTRWLRHEARLRRQRIVSDLVWGRIGDIQEVNMPSSAQIQASDVIAWSFTRRLAYSRSKWGDLATILLGSRTVRGALTNTQLDPITETVMRQKYPKKH